MSHKRCLVVLVSPFSRSLLHCPLIGGIWLLVQVELKKEIMIEEMRGLIGMMELINLKTLS